MIKKHFNKNLVMSVQDEKFFKSTNKCWIYNKLFAERDNCDFNLKLPKKVPAIFHILKVHDSHLMMQEIGVIPNKRIRKIHGFYN